MVAEVEVTRLPVNVPVLSKATICTAAAVLILPVLSTTISRRCNTLVQRNNEKMTTVGMPVGKLAIRVSATCLMTGAVLTGC